MHSDVISSSSRSRRTPAAQGAPPFTDIANDCRERAENEAAHKPAADEAAANKAAADNAEADKAAADKAAAADDKAEADKTEVGRARCSPKRAHERAGAAHGLDLPAGARAGHPTRGTCGPDDFSPTPGCWDQPEKGTRT